MKRTLIFIVSIIFLTGCASLMDDVLQVAEPDEEENVEPDEEKNEAKEDEALDEQEPEAEEGFWTKYEADSIEEFYELPEILETLVIPKEEMESQFGEDGNYKFEHTEQEIVKEHMDEDGRIYFDLDEHPIRNITSDEGKVNNITNYGDAFINTVDGLAYVIPEDHIDVAYTFFISHPPEDLADKELEDYRSWEQATNLERGIIQIVELTGPLINELGIMMDHDLYEGEGFEQILQEFEDLGSPVVLIPAPQSMLDLQLFENMQFMKSLWAEIGQFENPAEHKEEFDEIYKELRQETNNLIVRVNYTLSEDSE